MVNGPSDSPMEGNNSLGVGLTMVIPLMYFLFQQSWARWQRWALIASMALCSVSVLGSYSRGALLAIVAMSALLWLRGRNKMVMMLLALPFAGHQQRQGGISGKIFMGIVLGLSFYFIGRLFAHLGALNNWQPMLSASAMTVIFLFLALGMLWWTERR